jgi:hypothetical protein
MLCGHREWCGFHREQAYAEFWDELGDWEKQLSPDS